MFFHKYGNNTYKLIQFNVLCDFSKRFWRWLFHHKNNMCVLHVACHGHVMHLSSVLSISKYFITSMAEILKNQYR